MQDIYNTLEICLNIESSIEEYGQSPALTDFLSNDESLSSIEGLIDGPEVSMEGLGRIIQKLKDKFKDRKLIKGSMKELHRDIEKFDETLIYLKKKNETISIDGITSATVDKYVTRIQKLGSMIDKDIDDIRNSDSHEDLIKKYGKFVKTNFPKGEFKLGKININLKLETVELPKDWSPGNISKGIENIMDRISSGREEEIQIYYSEKYGDESNRIDPKGKLLIKLMYQLWDIEYKVIKTLISMMKTTYKKS